MRCSVFWTTSDNSFGTGSYQSYLNTTGLGLMFNPDRETDTDRLASVGRDIEGLLHIRRVLVQIRVGGQRRVGRAAVVADLNIELVILDRRCGLGGIDPDPQRECRARCRGGDAH